MKKMLKNLVSLTLICIFIISITACGAKSKENGGSGAASQATGSAEEKPVSIVWKPQHNATTYQISADAPFVKEIKEKFNVDMTFSILSGTTEEEALNLAIASGNVPDVIYLSNGSLITRFAKEGVITDISVDKFKKFAPQLYSFTDTAGGKNVFDYFKIDSKLYALPYITPSGAFHYTPVWRDDWLKNVGITKIPETLDEAEAAFYKFTKEDPDKNGKNDTYAMSDKGLTAVFGAYGANPFSVAESDFYWSLKNGTVTLSAVLPEMKDALVRINKWYKDGLIDAEFSRL